MVGERRGMVGWRVRLSHRSIRPQPTQTRAMTADFLKIYLCELQQLEVELDLDVKIYTAFLRDDKHIRNVQLRAECSHREIFG